MFKIYKNTKIFVLCPRGIVTGGPEALHQLVDKLINFGHNARIVYDPSGPLMKEYSHYKVELSNNIEDKRENILITPEIWIDKLKPYKKIQKAIWWLSVNNAQRITNINYFKKKSYLKDSLRNYLKIYNLLKKIYSKIESFKKVNFDFSKNKEIIHLAQSRYAEHYLKNAGAFYVYPLTDYLNKEYFLNKKKFKKENKVLYFPKKGFEITSKIIEAGSHLNWVPIKNMTPKEVSNLMARSKVYIDFGEHPGKDRVPREAAINGCCIIVGLRGAACFYQDVPIPLEYKFKVNPLDTKKIIKKIEDCIENYEERIKNFEIYQNIIKMNEKQFEIEVKQIFGIKKSEI